MNGRLVNDCEDTVILGEPVTVPAGEEGAFDMSMPDNHETVTIDAPWRLADEAGLVVFEVFGGNLVECPTSGCATPLGLGSSLALLLPLLLLGGGADRGASARGRNHVVPHPWQIVGLVGRKREVERHDDNLPRADLQVPLAAGAVGILSRPAPHDASPRPRQRALRVGDARRQGSAMSQMLGGVMSNEI